jgi:hypothetical protein
MLAFGFYIVGIAVVLYVRPSFMFNSRGWKEFGLSANANHSLFPFWMFALVWSVFSYALATLCTVFFANLTLRSSVSAPRSIAKPISSVVPTTPGYYIVDPNSTTSSAPRFIYYGAQPPTLDSLRGYSR